MIKKYKDFFENDKADFIHNFVLKSYYRIGWNDTGEPRHKAYPNLYSEYNSEDLTNLKILNPILKVINKKKDSYDKCVVNLTKPLDVNFIHTHPSQTVALYYANLTWNPEWGGETLFYEKDKTTIKLANPYTPNQLIIFKGSIPHTIKSQNLIGPSYRFTVSLFFND
jgi:Rps23 Pro-64 3,4-dihydroxylase Tpa1-like proline 4-hydroxylase